MNKGIFTSFLLFLCFCLVVFSASLQAEENLFVNGIIIKAEKDIIEFNMLGRTVEKGHRGVVFYSTIFKGEHCYLSKFSKPAFFIVTEQIPSSGPVFRAKILRFSQTGNILAGWPVEVRKIEKERHRENDEKAFLAFTSASVALEIAKDEEKKSDSLTKAAEGYEQSLKINDQDYCAYNNLGLVHQLNNKFNDAVENYQKAIKLNPRLAEFYNNLGVAQTEIGNYVEAFAAFQKVLQLNPRFIHVYYNLGYAYFVKTDYKEAISPLLIFAKAYPDDFDVHYLLGQSYTNLEDYMNGITELETARKIKPTHIEVHFCLVQAYKGIGNYRQAASILSFLIENAPSFEIQSRARTLLIDLEQYL